MKEAESRCEKLENDIYDMKRELAEETKRFRDKWRDAKKKERFVGDGFPLTWAPVFLYDMPFVLI